MTDFSDTLLQIKDRLILSDFIRKDVELTLKGREYVGNCPFHSEKTGSFFVSDEKCAFHCFGCGVSGDIFKYVMLRDGVTFPQALKKLADLVGIELIENKSKQKNAGIYKVLETATDFFEQNKSIVTEYMKKRELDDLTIYNTFHIGYAPNSNELYKYLINNGCKEADITKSGLFLEKYTNKFYPRFKERLIFPIYDRRNRVIAFGGRVVSNGEPKYLNSPETEIFLKRNTLYAYNIAYENVTDKKPFIVTEGYVDVITMHRYGFNTTVGTMGTALSTNHLAMLWKYSDEPIICMDGDDAGQKAMNRIARLALTALSPGKSLKFCLLPNSVDPDTFLKTEGANAMHSLLSRPISLSDFLWEEYLKELYKTDRTPEKTALWENKIFKDLETIPDNTIRRLYKSKIRSSIYNLNHSKSQLVIRKILNASAYKQLSVIEREAMCEYVLSYILVMRPALVSSMIEKLSYITFSNKSLRSFWNFIVESDDPSDVIASDKFSRVVEEIRTTGSKFYQINEQSDEELLNDWIFIFDKIVSKPAEKKEQEIASKEFAKSGSEKSWERLKALKMYSIQVQRGKNA